MLRLVVVIVTVAMVTGQFSFNPDQKKSKFCCSPDKWETTVWGVGGATTPNRPEKLGDPLLMIGRMAFDRQKHRVYSLLNTTFGTRTASIKTIEDLQNGYRYVINLKTSTCVKRKVGASLDNGCVPNDAVNLTTVYYGLSTNPFSMDMYKYWVMSGGMAMHTYLSVTTDQCLRVTESLTGAGNYAALAITMNYFGTTLEVSDESVFNIPSICKRSPIPGPPMSRLESLFGMSEEF